MIITKYLKSKVQSKKSIKLRLGRAFFIIFTSQLIKNDMKILNGIISVVLGFISLYLMFVKAQNDQDIIIGFLTLMMSVVFMCFMIMGEQKDEIEKLRNTISRINSIRY
jgi:hypothetical protein